MTFSIVARCAKTGPARVAVSSSSPAVAARCPHARAGVGAVSSQNVPDPRLGHPAAGPHGARRRGRAGDRDRSRRQPDAGASAARRRRRAGGTAIHSGRRVLGRWGEAKAADVACAGNLLADEGVPAAMVAAFQAASGPLAERLLAAMRAAVAAGGEEGPVHSAGLKIVDRVAWPVADLRVDWTEACPIAALGQLWELYAPQLDAYVTRALDPDAAPSYGVPGDR